MSTAQQNESKQNQPEMTPLQKCERELSKALLTIREQQHFITDITTSPFKLFDVNKTSKQYKSQKTRQLSARRTLVQRRATRNLLHAKRGKDLETFTELRNQIFHDTQKLAAMNLVIKEKAAAEVKIMEQQDKRDELLDKQLENKRQLKKINDSISNTRKRGRLAIEDDGELDPEQKAEARAAGARVRLGSQPPLVDAPPQPVYSSDPYAGIPDETVIQFANAAYPMVAPVVTRTAAIVRLQPQQQQAASSSSRPPLPALQDPHREMPSLERPTIPQLPPRPSSDAPSPSSSDDGKAMSDDENREVEAGLGALNIEPTGHEHDETPTRSRSSSVASSNTATMNAYVDENTT